MYGQGSLLQTLGGTQQPGNMLGVPGSNLTEEEKRFLEELIRKEVEKQKSGAITPYGRPF
jgi:hypothetical protein